MATNAPTTPNYISLTSGNTDYASQLAAIARRQKYAELLAQQGGKDIDVQSVGGVPTPISPFQGLAKVFQTGMGAYLSGKAGEDEAALEASDNAALLDALKNRSTITTPDVSTQGPNITLQVPKSASTTPGGVSAGPYSLDLALPSVTLPGSQTQRTPSELADYDLTQAGSKAMSKANRDVFLKQYTADQIDVDALNKVTPQVNSMLADPKTDPAVRQILTAALASGDTARINEMLGTIDVNAVPKAPTAQELSDSRDFAAAQLLKPGLTRQQWNADNAGLTAGAEAKARLPLQEQLAAYQEQLKASDEVPYDPLTLDNDVHIYLATGGQVKPTFGGRGVGQKNNNTFRAGVAKVMRDANISPQDFATGRAAQKADSASLTSLTKLADNSKSFIGMMDKNINLVDSVLAKGGADGAPIINKYTQWLRGDVAADADVKNLDAALTAVSSEAAKLRSGSMGNTPTNEALQKEIRGQLNSAMSKGQISSMMHDILLKEGVNRSESYQEQINQITGRIGTGIVSSSSKPSVAAPVSAATPRHMLNNREIVPNRNNTGWVYKDTGGEAK